MEVTFSPPSSTHTLELPSGLLAIVIMPLDTTREDLAELSQKLWRLADRVALDAGGARRAGQG